MKCAKCFNKLSLPHNKLSCIGFGYSRIWRHWRGGFEFGPSRSEVGITRSMQWRGHPMTSILPRNVKISQKKLPKSILKWWEITRDSAIWLTIGANHTALSILPQMPLQSFKFRCLSVLSVLSEWCFTLALFSAPTLALALQCKLFENNNLVVQLFAETY